MVRVGIRAAVFPEGYVERSPFYRFAYFAALASSRLRALAFAIPPSRPRTAIVARVIQQMFEELSDGKVKRVMRAVHPEAELEMPGGLGTFRGERAVLQGWNAFQEAFPGSRNTLREWIDGEGNNVVCCLAMDAMGGISGIQLDNEVFGVWDLRDGSVIRVRFFTTKAEALEAVGLSEAV